MWEELTVVTGSVVTLFLMMGVGFFFGKRGLLSPEALGQLSRLLLYVVCPAVMISAFQVERTSQVVWELLVAAAALAGTYVMYMLLAALCFRRAPAEERGVLRFAAIYGNTGFMGIPLISAVLGERAMMITVMSLVVFNVTTWTHGTMVIGGREYVSLKKTVLNPGVIGFAIALILFAGGLTLPGPVGTAVDYISDLNTPLAMIVIGGQMASADLPETFRMKKLYWASALKLLIFPLLTAAVLLPFRLPPMMFSAIVILSACPTAGATSLFCQTMGRDASLAARQVTLSTLLCVVTLPLVAAAASLLGGMWQG